MPEPATPENFHHYRILRKDDGSLWELGRGAMGVTYKAEDANLHTTVALKVINSLYLDNSTARERFIREARAAASLRHRNVAAVHHLGQDGQTFFYAMEFIDGVTVTKLIREEGPQPWARVLRYALQVAYALMAAHDRKLVHRDIKPDNLMLVAEAGPDDLVVKVIDFGLAKSLAELGGSMVNLSGSGFIGTPSYASPEQCEEIAPDIRSDIYSLGVVIWYALTGAPLFGGPLGKVFAQHINAEPPWDKLPADLPGAVCSLLKRMLAKDRADRPQTPAELRREIDACLRGDAPAATSPLAPFTADPAATLPEPPSGLSVVDLGATLVEPIPEAPLATTAATLVGFPQRPVAAAASQQDLPLEAVPSRAVPPANEPLLPIRAPFPAAVGKDPEAVGMVPSTPETVRLKKCGRNRRWLWAALVLAAAAVCLGVIFGGGEAKKTHAAIVPAVDTRLIQAKRLIESAQRELRFFNKDSDKSSALHGIAAAQAKAGDIAGARQTAQSIEDDDSLDKPAALRDIAAAQAQAGDIAGARQTAQSIEVDLYKVFALREIAAAQAKAGDMTGSRQSFSQALQKVESIKDPYRVFALHGIAAAQTKAGDMAGAQQTVQNLKDGSVKDSALRDIATAQAKVGDVAGAQQTVQNLKDGSDKDFALNAIVAAQAVAGDLAGMQRTAQSIKDHDWNTSVLSAIAAAQAKVGDVAGALQKVQSMKDDSDKVFALLGIAAAQAKAGDMAGSRLSFSQAQQTAQGIKADYSKASALRNIAAAQAKAGDMAGSRLSFSQAQQTAQGIKADSDKAYALHGIAAAQTKAGDMAGAQQTAQSMKDGSFKAGTLLDIAAAQARAGDVAAAEQTVNQRAPGEAKCQGFTTLAIALFTDSSDSDD